MKNILLIYTGGTVGMQKNTELGALVPFSMTLLLREIPELNNIAANITPLQFEVPIDSSNATFKTWQAIADMIYEHQSAYDTFVVLHGTDTMAYSATACSFMLQGFGKPLIFTGSQFPITYKETDAKKNILGAVNFAIANGCDNAYFNEVGIFFDEKLFLASRTTKVHSSKLNAFGSPNSLPVFEKGKFDPSYRSSERNKVKYPSNFLQNGIVVLSWHPLLTKEDITYLLHDRVKIVVIQSFGSGNLPSFAWVLTLLQRFVKKGGIVINKTQCFQGQVSQGVYETSSALNTLNVIPAKDMTLEAIIVKASWLYPHKTNVLEFKEAFFKDYCGEMG